MLGKTISHKLKINNTSLVAYSILFPMLRIIGDIIFNVFGSLNNSGVLIWKFFTTAVIFGFFSLLIKRINFFGLKNSKTFSDSDYLKYSLNLLLIISALMIFSGLAPLNFENGNGINLPELILIEAVSFASIIVAIIVLSFIHNMLILHRHKTTKLYINILIFFIVYFTLAQIFTEAIPLLSGSFEEINWIPLIIAMVVFFLSVKKNSWIALLPKNHKWKLLGISALTIIFAILFITINLDQYSKHTNSLNLFMPGAATILGMSMVYLALYNLRIFFAILLSFPTTSIMQKRNVELSSLTYLNRLIAETVDFDKLVDTVTRLALQASGSTGAWIEFYDKEFPDIKSVLNIDKSTIDKIHSENNIYVEFQNYAHPFYVDSIRKSKNLSIIKKYINHAESLIVLPVYAGEERIGSLIVINNEEYGYDYNEVQALSAFCDNLSIGMENARLLERSLENERYKKELLIAKDIQKKLLPESLPNISGFSLSSLNIFADEVGGDYYDCLRLKDNSYCLIIADVSGKGMPAAFYMAQLKGAALAMAQVSSSGSELLKRINKSFYKSMEKKLYITMETLTIKPENSTVFISRAGHMPALLKTESGINWIKPKGIGIGLAASEVFDPIIEEFEINLSIGDSILLFTDGLNELRNSDDIELGFEPLAKILRNDYSNANEIIDNIRRLIKEAALDITLDDTTALSLIYKGKPDELYHNALSFETKNVL